MRKRLKAICARFIPFWKCRECGKANRLRSEISEFTPADMEELGIDPAEYTPGDWKTIPDIVDCGRCGAQFRCLGMAGVEAIGEDGEHGELGPEDVV